MIIKFQKTALKIFKENKEIDFNINKDINILEIRNEFNTTIETLSLKHNSLAYWTMRLSERNTLFHNLFLDICYIRLLEKFNKEDLVIYTDNISLYLYYKKNAEINFNDKLQFEFKKLKRSYKPYISTFIFLLKKLYLKIKYIDKKYKKPLSNTIIIQTWVSDNNFKNNSFYDSYYADLASYLKNNGHKVLTWPILYNVTNKRKVIKYLRSNADDFLIIEDYLHNSDYFEAIKHFFQKRFLNFNTILVGDFNVSSLFQQYQKEESIEMVSLFFSFTKRLKQEHNTNITFVQHYENMIGEKALILGVKKYLPHSKVIGYFHSTKPKNLLCLDYAGDDEYKRAPKPNIIIFNSNVYKKYYQNKYKSFLHLYTGTAFKQRYLKNISHNKKQKTEKILVLFSGTISEISLMFEWLNAIKENYFFIFRMHPLNNFKIKEFYEKNNYEVVNDIDLNLLFIQVNKVISTYSSVALESALNGLKVGLLYNKKQLLLNPFDDTDIQNYQLISNIKELELFLDSEYKNQNIKQIFNFDKEEYKIFLELI